MTGSAPYGNPPRGRGLIVAAPASGSGKTLVTAALLQLLRRRGMRVAAAKAGPDYIDPTFHAAASGGASLNLDLWAMRRSTLWRLISALEAAADIVLCEGVMGLFDGTGPDGEAGSTAELARPPPFRPPPFVPSPTLPRRRGREGWGLEGDGAGPAGGSAISSPSPHPNPPPLAGEGTGAWSEISLLPPLGQRIAVARDDAFLFAYPAVLEGWRRQGAELSLFSPLADEAPAPASDAVYLPGGYPELHAGRLAAATPFLTALRRTAASGAQIYGECGGYMVLGETLRDAEGEIHRMAGLLPLATSFTERRLHLGYRAATLLGAGPLGAAGALFRGHEFHYATTAAAGPAAPLFALADS